VAQSHPIVHLSPLADFNSEFLVLAFDPLDIPLHTQTRFRLSLSGCKEYELT